MNNDVVNNPWLDPKNVRFTLSVVIKVFVLAIVSVVVLSALIRFDVLGGLSDSSSEFFGYQKTYGELAETGLAILLADTPEKRMRGLSGFNKIRDNQAMLFKFDEVGSHGFWMKDMNFAIDIMWMNEYYEIVHIEENILPSTYPKVFGKDIHSKYVLETNAGFVAKHYIKLGDVLQVL